VVLLLVLTKPYLSKASNESKKINITYLILVSARQAAHSGQPGDPLRTLDRGCCSLWTAKGPLRTLDRGSCSLWTAEGALHTLGWR